MSSTISKITVKQDIVRIAVENDDTVSHYRIFLTDYLSSGLRLNQQLEQKQLDELDQMHAYCYGLSKALNKLSYSDRSEKEIEQALKKTRQLSSSMIRKIIDQLHQMGYLDDKAVAASQLYVDQNKLLGRRKTLYNLTDRGVDRSTALQTIEQVSDEEETQRGMLKANQLLRRIRGKSYRQTVYELKKGLSASGYEHADEIIGAMDFKMDEQSERDSLKIQLEKARRRYGSRYEGRKLHDAVFRYLLTKGYSSEMINSIYSEEVDYENQ